jgi:hypothetical protein
MGVLVNVPTEWKDGRQVGESGNRLKGQLSRFCAQKVIPLWNFRGHTGNAIVEFTKDWNGFRNALAFENYFEAEGSGRRHWKQKQNQGSKLFGWVARTEDYNFPGLIGDHLRKNGDLKTIDDLENERARKNDRLEANLADEIEVKNKHLQELECRYNESTASLEKMMGQREQLLQKYNEGVLVFVTYLFYMVYMSGCMYFFHQHLQVFNCQLTNHINLITARGSEDAAASSQTFSKDH